MKTIGILNQKGGVGKTTTAVNLAMALTEKGKRVLLVDFDPQANATATLSENQAEYSVCDIMKSMIERTPGIRTVDAIVHSKNRPDLLPADIRLATLEITMTSVVGRESMLKRILKQIQGKYDYVIIDALPALSVLAVNVFAASDYIIIPVRGNDTYSLTGFDAVLEYINIVNDNAMADVKKLGEVVTMYDGRNRNDRGIYENILKDERTDVFGTIISHSTKVAEAASKGKTVLEYEPKGKAAAQYRAFADEVLQRIGDIDA